MHRRAPLKRSGAIWTALPQRLTLLAARAPPACRVHDAPAAAPQRAAGRGAAARHPLPAPGRPQGAPGGELHTCAAHARCARETLPGASHLSGSLENLAAAPRRRCCGRWTRARRPTLPAWATRSSGGSSCACSRCWAAGGAPARCGRAAPSLLEQQRARAGPCCAVGSALGRGVGRGVVLAAPLAGPRGLPAAWEQGLARRPAPLRVRAVQSTPRQHRIAAGIFVPASPDTETLALQHLPS